MSPARTAIVIPMHDALRQIPQCIESLSWAHEQDVTIVVVDTGSTDWGPEWIAAHAPDVVVIVGDADMWWTEAVELGCRFAVRELAVERLGLLNIDCTWNVNGFTAAKKALERHPSTIVCSHVQRGGDGTTTFAGGIVRKSGMLTLRVAESVQGKASPSGWVAWCGGQGVLFDSQVYLDTGGFDYQTFPHYFGDSDFCFRAARHGTRVWYCSESTVNNDDSTTGLAPHRSGDLGTVWRTLSSRRSVFNVRENLLFYARHARWCAPMALVHVYSLWAVWSARSILRGRCHV
jgi:GT2 family glycosyltransferase